MGREDIPGKMEEFIKAIGKIIKCMDMDSLLGKMEEFIPANIKMIKNLGQDILYGLLGENILGNGLMENSTENEYIKILKDKLNIIIMLKAKD